MLTVKSLASSMYLLSESFLLQSWFFSWRGPILGSVGGFPLPICPEYELPSFYQGTTVRQKRVATRPCSAVQNYITRLKDYIQLIGFMRQLHFRKKGREIHAFGWVFINSIAVDEHGS